MNTHAERKTSRRLWSRKEDRILRELCGVIPAEEIAAVLNRPKNGVHHRIEKLGLDGRLVGEHHWNAKIPNLQAAMLMTLHDAGFKPKEIEQSFTGFNLSLPQISTLLNSGRAA